MAHKITFKLSNKQNTSTHIIELHEGQSYDFGRQATGMVLPDSSVSRQHCKLLIENAQLFLIDEGSTNGTRIGKQRISKHLVIAGARAQLGIYTLEFLEVPRIEATSVIELPPLPPPADGKKSGANADTASDRDTSPGHTQTMTATASGKRNWLHALENKKFEPQDFADFYKMAITKPAEFFKVTDFSGSMGVSYFVIAVCAVICGALTSVMVSRWAFMMPFLAAPSFVMTQVTMSLLMVTIISGFAHFFRKFMATKATFSQFLRFWAYASLIWLLASAIGLVAFPLMSLLSLIVFVWVAFGFFSVFRPRLIPLLIVAFCLLVLSAVATSPLFYLGTRMTPSFRWFHSKNSTPNPGVFSQSGDSWDQWTAALGNADPAKRQQFEKLKLLKHAPFTVGETYRYGLAVNTNEGSRQGELSIHVKSMGRDGAEVEVDGQYNGKAQKFERKISQEPMAAMADLMALTARNTTDELDPSHFLNILLAIQMPLDLMTVAGPLAFLSDEIKLETGQTTAVGGIAGYSFAGWPVASKYSNDIGHALGENKILQVAVSNQVALPLMVQGQDSKLRIAYTIQLENYNK